MPNTSKTTLGYIVLNIEEDKSIPFVWGTYSSLDIAKKEAEEMIIEFVVNYDAENGRTYDELHSLGAGFEPDSWYETDMGVGNAISWKIDPDSAFEEMIVIPVPAKREPSSLISRLERMAERSERLASRTTHNVLENPKAAQTLLDALKDMRKDLDSLLDDYGLVEADKRNPQK